MLLIHVVLGFGVDIIYTGPEADDDHEFTVQHPSQHILKKIHGDKFRTYNLGS